MVEDGFHCTKTSPSQCVPKGHDFKVEELYRPVDKDSAVDFVVDRKTTVEKNV